MANSDSLAEAKSQIRPALDRSDFPVYVFGPSLNPDESVPAPTSPLDGHDSIRDYAKYLRYLTKQRLEELGYKVDFGESPDVLAFWQRFFGAANPGAAEILHADKRCEAIIIFPATFGPMAELALFALTTPIAEKTMAIVHQDYEEADSFFRRGLLELFLTCSGQVRYLDYGNPEACVGYAERHVEGKYWKFCRDVDIYKEITSRRGGAVFKNALENRTD